MSQLITRAAHIQLQPGCDPPAIKDKDSAFEAIKDSVVLHRSPCELRIPDSGISCAEILRLINFVHTRLIDGGIGSGLAPDWKGTLQLEANANG